MIKRSFDQSAESTGVPVPRTPDHRDHPVFARLWAPLARGMDRQGGAERRVQLLAGLEGRIVEVGAGTGTSFPHLPQAVTDVVAVEPEPYLRRLAHEEAEQSAVPIEVVDGVAGDLPVADNSADAVVTSLVLCSVPDQRRALAEIARVLRPGGRLRFFEHVVAERPAHRRLQRALDATVWPTLAGGCHTARETVDAIRAAGLTITSLERMRFPDTPVPMPTSPHALGEAVPTRGTDPRS